MAVETSTPFRRVVGTLIRGVGDGLLGATSGIPLPGATVIFTASLRAAGGDELIVLDPVEARTDNNAVLRSVTTGEKGVPLLVTDDMAVGAIGWTWKATITGPTLATPLVYEFPVPNSAEELDLKEALTPGIAFGPGTLIFAETADDLPAGFRGFWIDPASNIRPVY